ncbi:hypothetical protein EIP86_010253 [Pleurotus ostreatoroseus]|nr:hypothetical protein EIP86_010253 [Pleurotus ostreatoroseus]
MPLPDEQWQAELHRRMADMYRLQSQLQQSNAELGQQNKDLKSRVAELEHEKKMIELVVSNARQAAIQETEHQKAALEKLTMEYEKTRKDTDMKARHIETLEAQIERTAQEAEQKDVLIKTLTTDISRLRIDIKEVNLKAAGHKAQIDSLNTELASYKQTASDQVLQANNEKDALASRALELSAKLDELNTELSRKEDALLAQSKKLGSLQDEKTALSTRLEETQEQLQQFNDVIERIQTEKDAANTLFETYYEKTNEQTQMLEQQRNQLLDALSKNDTLQATLLLLEAQVAELKLYSRSMESRRAASVKVDKAIQADPLRVDIAIQTAPESTAPSQTPTQEHALSPPVSRPGRRNGTAPRRPVMSIEDMELPATRRDFLEAFESITIPESARTETAGFTRTFLAATLGGGMQGVLGTFDVKKERKPLSEKHDLLGCLYPQRHLNPWLPPEPGTHGYLFLGLVGPAKDHEKFLAPSPRALFICEGSHWKYYGQYVVERNPERDITLEEWKAFSNDFKDGDSGYCAMTLNKSMGGSSYQALKNDHKTSHDQKVREVRERYDAGQLRVPCISLQCIGYNEELVEGLKTQGPGSMSQVARKRKRSSSDDAGSVSDTDASRPVTRSRITIRIPPGNSTQTAPVPAS